MPRAAAQASRLAVNRVAATLLGGVLVVPLCGILRVFALSSSFHLRLVQYSTSVATNHNSEISLTFCFDWIASRVSRWACSLRTPHVLLLSHLDLLPCPLASCAPFGMLSMTSGSSQWLLSNTPTPKLNNPRGHEQSTNPPKLAS